MTKICRIQKMIDLVSASSKNGHVCCLKTKVVF